MKFKGIKKKLEGQFITRYDLIYETNDQKTKVYEMISRNKNLENYDALANHPAEAVVIIMENSEGSHILLNKEFRMACGSFVYNFPAGLIDEGEDAIMGAKRELWEETGLEIIQIDDVIGDSFSAIGFSNEKNVCVVGKAKGNFVPSTSSVEEIEAKWYSKKEVRELLKQYPFAARTQAYCYLWSMEK